MKHYAVIKDWEDFKEVERMLINAGIPFGVSNFNDGYAFIFCSN